MTWATIRLRLRALIADTATTDGTERRPLYAVFQTFAGHILLTLVCALDAEAWGASPGWALGIGAGLWVGLWEGRQYLAGRRAGLSKWATLRDWWLHDAWAYACGLAVAAAVLLDLGPWWLTGALVFAGASAVAAAVIWGRAPEELQPIVARNPPPL